MAVGSFSASGRFRGLPAFCSHVWGAPSTLDPRQSVRRELHVRHGACTHTENTEAPDCGISQDGACVGWSCRVPRSPSCRRGWHAARFLRPGWTLGLSGPQLTSPATILRFRESRGGQCRAQNWGLEPGSVSFLQPHWLLPLSLCPNQTAQPVTTHLRTSPDSRHFPPVPLLLREPGQCLPPRRFSASRGFPRWSSGSWTMQCPVDGAKGLCWSRSLSVGVQLSP